MNEPKKNAREPKLVVKNRYPRGDRKSYGAIKDNIHDENL